MAVDPFDPEMLTDIDPFNLPGSGVGADQLPRYPATRVLLSSAWVMRKLGVHGVLRAVSSARGRTKDVLLSYAEAPLPGERAFLDLEQFAATVVSELSVLKAGLQRLLGETPAVQTNQQVVRLLQALAHGSVREGLHVGVEPGSRKLSVSGGRMLIIPPDDAAGGALVAGMVVIPTVTPLEFWVCSGEELVDGNPETFSDVPRRCRSSDGANGKADGLKHNAYVEHLLCVDPMVSPASWYLFLGDEAAKPITKKADVPHLPEPKVPRAYADTVLPLAKVLVRGGSNSILRVTPLAPRISQDLLPLGLVAGEDE